jgi:membrane associated rhomboid family serine protease
LAGQQYGERRNTSMMKKLVGNVVSVLMEVLMWITFVGCTLGGLGYGYNEFGVKGAIGGLVLGAIAGIILNLGWWSVSTFQEIRNYLKEIAEKR